MRKTLSLLLAIVMMLSVLVIPAVAAMPDEDVVEPCAWMDCSRCGDSARISSSSSILNRHVTISSCSYINYRHNHFVDHAERHVLECPNCGVYSLTVILDGYNYCEDADIIISY